MELEDWLAALRCAARSRGDHATSFTGYLWVDLFHRGFSPVQALDHVG